MEPRPGRRRIRAAFRYGIAAFLAGAWVVAASQAGLAADPFKRIIEIRSPTGVSDVMVDYRSTPANVIVADGNGTYYRLAAKRDRSLRLVPVRNHRPPATEWRSGMIPDGRVTHGLADIRMTYLTKPTRRYAHGALGDRIEASSLRVITDDGSMLEYDLGPESVFEDIAPRLADIDGDGRDEIFVVHSYLRAGAALAIYGIVDGRLDRVGETPALGMPNRWLNPIGVADFDGDGVNEIALVTTPHIGGTLQLYRLTGGKFRLVNQRAGFSNHAIGARELGLSAIFDADGDGLADIAVPDAARTNLRLVSFAIGSFYEIVRIEHRAPISTALRLVDIDGDGQDDLIYGLADGTVVVGFR